MISSTTNMVRDQVYNKMMNLTFHGIVNNTVLHALPIDESELNFANKRAISTYTLRALESAGGFDLLENAIENTKDPMKKNFLSKIYAICHESSMEVANRVAMEDLNLDGATTGEDVTPPSDDPTSPEDSGAEPNLDDKDMAEEPDNSDTSIDDVKAPDDTEQAPLKPEVIRQGIPYQKLVADAKMTDKEYQRYVDRVGKLDLPEVSKMINERVETAMKAEKETYRMIDESDQKLREAITNKAEAEGEDLSEDQADEIKESVLEVPLKHSTRRHVSLISTLQTAAIESLQIHNVSNFNKVDPDILLSVTENYGIDGIFKHTEPTLEQMFNEAFNTVKYQAANECACPEKAIVMGTAIAAIVYTFLQTLHSMNLVRITPTDVQRCCDKRTPFEEGRVRPLDSFDVKVRSALEKHNRNLVRMNYAPDIESTIDTLNHIRSKVYTARDNGFPVEESTIKAIENTISRAMERKHEVEASLEATLESGTSYGHSPKFFETDVCNMNRITRTFKNTPVDAIEFRCTEGASIINVLGIKDGKNVKTTSYALESAIDVPTAAYLKGVVLHSTLPDIKYGESKPSITSYIDGHRTRIR